MVDVNRDNQARVPHHDTSVGGDAQHLRRFGPVFSPSEPQALPVAAAGASLVNAPGPESRLSSSSALPVEPVISLFRPRPHPAAPSGNQRRSNCGSTSGIVPVVGDGAEWGGAWTPQASQLSSTSGVAGGGAGGSNFFVCIGEDRDSVLGKNWAERGREGLRSDMEHSGFQSGIGIEHIASKLKAEEDLQRQLEAQRLQASLAVVAQRHAEEEEEEKRARRRVSQRSFDVPDPSAAGAPLGAAAQATHAPERRDRRRRVANGSPPEEDEESGSEPATDKDSDSGSRNDGIKGENANAPRSKEKRRMQVGQQATVGCRHESDAMVGEHSGSHGGAGNIGDGARPAQPSTEAAKPGPLLAVGAVLREWVVVSSIGAGSFGETFSAVPLSCFSDEDRALLTNTTVSESSSSQAVGLAVGAAKPFSTIDDVLERRTDTSRYVCIKVEKAERRNVLRWEVLSLKKVQACPHVVRYLGSGRCGELNFLVMEKLGANLAELRRLAPHGMFDLHTMLRTGLMALDALEGIHELGMIHRDVKPSNFVVGVGENSRRIFLIDFGLAKRHRKSNGEVKPARAVSGFRGTSRYASLSSHRQQDLGRVDDLWSLLFMLVEFGTGSLPWRRYKEKEEIGTVKASTIGPQLVKHLPREFVPFVEHLQGLRYESQPDYSYLRSLLQRAIERRGYAVSKPLDWERIVATGADEHARSHGAEGKAQRHSAAAAQDVGVGMGKAATSAATTTRRRPSAAATAHQRQGAHLECPADGEGAACGSGDGEDAPLRERRRSGSRRDRRSKQDRAGALFSPVEEEAPPVRQPPPLAPELNEEKASGGPSVLAVGDHGEGEGARGHCKATPALPPTGAAPIICDNNVPHIVPPPAPSELAAASMDERQQAQGNGSFGSQAQLHHIEIHSPRSPQEQPRDLRQEQERLLQEQNRQNQQSMERSSGAAEQGPSAHASQRTARTVPPPLAQEVATNEQSECWGSRVEGRRGSGLVFEGNPAGACAELSPFALHTPISATAPRPQCHGEVAGAPDIHGGGDGHGGHGPISLARVDEGRLASGAHNSTPDEEQQPRPSPQPSQRRKRRHSRQRASAARGAEGDGDPPRGPLCFGGCCVSM